MTDVKLLQEKIDQSGYKVRFIAEKVGITYQGLRKKMQNKSEFKVSEIQTLCRLLDLSEQEREAIFFCA